MFKLYGGFGNLDIPCSVFSLKNQYSSSTISGFATTLKLELCSNTISLPIMSVPTAMSLSTSATVPIIRATSPAPRTDVLASRCIEYFPIFVNWPQSPESAFT